MQTVKRFEELEVWQLSRNLIKEVYQQTENGKIKRDFGLRDQIRKASVSIISNISEGFERKTNKEFIYFLYIAKGSAGELRSQFYIALDLEYIEQAQFRNLLIQVEKITRSLSGFIKYLESNSRPNPK